MRITENKHATRILNTKPGGLRLRRINVMVEDLITFSSGRNEWQRLRGKTKAHLGI